LVRSLTHSITLTRPVPKFQVATLFPLPVANQRVPRLETVYNAKRLHPETEAINADELLNFEEQVVVLLNEYLEDVRHVETVSVTVET